MIRSASAYLGLFLGIGLVTIAACGADDGDTSTTQLATSSAGANGAGGSTTNASGAMGGQAAVVSVGVAQGGSGCGLTCSPDFQFVVDCNGNTVTQCMGEEGCDPDTGMCANGCDVATANKQSIGCEYYATDLQNTSAGHCFAAFVANTWHHPVKINVEYQGIDLMEQNFVAIPSSSGGVTTYAPYDPSVGVPVGEVAIVFLSHSPASSVACPVTPARTTDVSTIGTGIGDSFRITADVPVVAYQMNPYGGGSAAVTGASLLLPTSSWGDNYIGVNAYDYALYGPTMNIIAQEDGTTVTMLPIAAVQGGGTAPNDLPAGAANVPLSFVLNAGQNAQFGQNAELTGSVISADKPIGLMAGQPCMQVPAGTAYCDHGEQMIPPIQSLGSQYAGVMHRPRVSEPAIWRVIGAVDGTQLTYDQNVGGPSVINQGEVVEFITATPFVIDSQDEDHPFILLTYMSGSQWSMVGSGNGDPEMVLNIPTDQYLNKYVFFTDPSYPETNLVIVRRKDGGGNFFDVDLDCAGVLTGWQPLGTDFEWTRVDLQTGDFQDVGNCSNGRHEISSQAPFGLTVWGWGTEQTSFFTANVSYGYPAGMNLRPINTVVVPVMPN